MPRFFFGASFGVAVKPHLVVVVVDDPVQVNLLVGTGLDGGSQFGIEKPGALAADHQIAVAVIPQPGDVVLGGNACIHHHHRIGGCLEGFKHGCQCLVFVGIAGKHFRAAHEAGTVQHQSQGEQRAVAALLFRVPPPGLGLALSFALKEGVGEVVQRHRVPQAEQLRHPIKQVIFDGLAMGHQRIRGTVEPHQAQALEVHAEQLAESAAVAQPPPSGPFRSGLCHAPDDQRQGCCPLPTVEPQPLQKLIQADLPHSPQSYMLHPHRARAH